MCCTEQTRPYYTEQLLLSVCLLLRHYNLFGDIINYFSQLLPPLYILYVSHVSGRAMSIITCYSMRLIARVEGSSWLTQWIVVPLICVVFMVQNLDLP